MDNIRAYYFKKYQVSFLAGKTCGAKNIQDIAERFPLCYRFVKKALAKKGGSIKPVENI
jgi:hypothetical protein